MLITIKLTEGEVGANKHLRQQNMQLLLVLIVFSFLNFFQRHYACKIVHAYIHCIRLLKSVSPSIDLSRGSIPRCFPTLLETTMNVVFGVQELRDSENDNRLLAFYISFYHSFLILAV